MLVRRVARAVVAARTNAASRACGVGAGRACGRASLLHRRFSGTPSFSAAASAAREVARLRAELNADEDPFSRQGLARAAEICKAIFLAQRKLVREAKQELAAASSYTEKDEAARKVELAQAKAKLAEAEAELAQAEAELAEAEAKGKPTEALRADKAALQAAVNQLQHNLNGGRLAPFLPSEMKVDPDLAWPAGAALLAPLAGRDAQVRQMLNVAMGNYMARRVRDKSEFQFLVAAGQVRIGKTRMGLELPRLMSDPKNFPRWKFLRPDIAKHWLRPLYVDINFTNGPKFNPSVDLDAQPGVALGARVASMFLGRAFSDFGPVIVSQLSIEAVLAEIVDQRLRLERELCPDLSEEELSDKVVPLVVHLDEYGAYVRSMVAEGRSRDCFKRMLFTLGTAMATPTHPRLRKLHDAGRYFVVPVATGTSIDDVDIRLSTYRKLPLDLPPLSFGECKSVAKAMLVNREHGMSADDAAALVDSNPWFQVALGDCGGFPGFLDLLCQATARSAGGHDAVEAFWESVRNSPDLKLDKSQPYTELVRLMLARAPISDDDEFAIIGSRGDKVGMRALLDRGILSAEDILVGWRLGLFVLPLLAQVGAGAVRVDHVCGLVTEANPWTWQRFERFHASYVAAVLSALYHTRAYFERAGERVTLRHVLRGARAAKGTEAAELLSSELELHDVCTSYVQEAEWCLPEKDGKRQGAVVLTQRHAVRTDDPSKVFLAANRNPIVDAYFTVTTKGGSAGGADGKQQVCVFLQTKHAEHVDQSTTKVSVSDMNKARALLTERLGEVGWDEAERPTLLVYVTNKAVAGKADDASDGLAWISHSEMAEHLGPSLAQRGLLPNEVPRGAGE